MAQIYPIDSLEDRLRDVLYISETSISDTIISAKHQNPPEKHQVIQPESAQDIQDSRAPKSAFPITQKSNSVEKSGVDAAHSIVNNLKQNQGTIARGNYRNIPSQVLHK